MSSGSFEFPWGHSDARRFGQVHSGWCRLTLVQVGVACFIRDRLGHSVRLGVAGFIQVRVGRT